MAAAGPTRGPGGALARSSSGSRAFLLGARSVWKFIATRTWDPRTSLTAHCASVKALFQQVSWGQSPRTLQVGKGTIRERGNPPAEPSQSQNLLLWERQRPGSEETNLRGKDTFADTTAAQGRLRKACRGPSSLNSENPDNPTGAGPQAGRSAPPKQGAGGAGAWLGRHSSSPVTGNAAKATRRHAHPPSERPRAAAPRPRGL